MSLDVTLYLEIDVGAPELQYVCFFDSNYTHNCASMAREAGLYKYVWRPEECEPPIEFAKDLIEHLRSGIARMEDDPERFTRLNPENGWGSYETFLPWLREYLAACIKYPKARIAASR